MRAHEPMPPLPVELHGHARVDGGQLGARLDRVPDVVAALLGADDPPRAAGVTGQRAFIGRLAAAAGVEDGAIEEDGVRLGVDVDDGRIGLAQVGIGVAEVLAHEQRLPAWQEVAAWIEPIAGRDDPYG